MGCRARGASRARSCGWRAHAALALLGGAASACGSASPPIPSDPFWLGLNYPWHHYGHDAGENAWGHDGVSAAASRARVEADLITLGEDGARVVRWFVLANGAAAPEFDAAGDVVGLDPLVFEDLDAAFAAAADARVYLLPVLFDFFWFEAASVVDGVPLGGHGELMRDPARRAALLDRAVLPLVDRYEHHPNLAGWDLINEPEWAVLEIDPLVGDAVPLAVMHAWLEELALAVRAASDHPVTVGSASIGHLLSYWADLPLDLFEVHHYAAELPDPDATAYGLDRPLLLGEFPTRDAPWDLGELLDLVHQGGYAGALPWAFYEGEASDYAGVRDTYRAWAREHREQLLDPPAPAW